MVCIPPISTATASSTTCSSSTSKPHLYYAVSWASWTPTLPICGLLPAARRSRRSSSVTGAQEVTSTRSFCGTSPPGIGCCTRSPAFIPTYQIGDRWNPAFDIAAPGDYDTDGRIDDIFLYRNRLRRVGDRLVSPQRPDDSAVPNVGRRLGRDQRRRVHELSRTRFAGPSPESRITNVPRHVVDTAPDIGVALAH